MMRNEIINFIRENNLSLFGRNTVRPNSSSILKTKDAREVQNKVTDLISDNFVFQDTKQLLKLFSFTDSLKEVLKRQEFFNSIEKTDNSFFKNLEKPKSFWRPKYDVVVATEDEATLINLKNINCPVVFVNSESDLRGLDKYDLVQVLNCENFYLALERLPQAVFVNSINDVYLERFLVLLSGWKKNLEFLKSQELNNESSDIVSGLCSLLYLLDDERKEKISFEEIESELERMNKDILDKLKAMTLSGESVVSLLSKGLPKEVKDLLNSEISSTRIPSELFELSIPIRIDEKEVEGFLKRQSSQEFTNFSAIVQKNSEGVKKIEMTIRRLEEELIYLDFIGGVSKFISGFNNFPEFNEGLAVENSKNIFLSNPQPISFNLTNDKRCSILTGANSGGKTTLIEHIIQLIVLSQMGLPVSGKFSVPLFTDVYYFAKNKGSMSKGAFETLLTQMSEINPGKKTIIFADEIESVTEPGVAGQIIVSTANYFLNKNCFLIIATHLGQEIQPILSAGCRIDGIEAKGLTEDYELIVDHNPVLGRIANSTPELIVEKMAKSLKKEYFVWLYNNLKTKGT